MKCQNIYEPSTASKKKERFPANYPTEILSAKGAYITDKNGRCYLDFMCSLGPIILGYRYDKVDDSVCKTIRDCGTIFSLSHPLEKKLADLLCDMIPSAEMVRFAHNGADPCAAAVRLARFITGKDLILSFSYHGATDTFMACTKADKGVPKVLKKLIKEFDYNDNEGIKRLFEENKGKIACVILEPHTIRFPKEGFLPLLRELCDSEGALLIFDEVVSFPRYPNYSAQSYFNVTPDLTCISKAMANGYPISALVGKEEYMKHLADGEVFFSTTFGGNLVGVSAALATLGEVIYRDVPLRISELGKRFKDGIRKDSRLETEGYYWRQFFKCSDDTRWKLYQECIKEGVFFSIPIFFNYSMTNQDIDKATKSINKALENLETVELIRPATEVFRKV